MKLNLVADYELPNGKRFVGTFAIHNSNNLCSLMDMTAQRFALTDGRWLTIRPVIINMCESLRKADAVAATWRTEYMNQGRLWDFQPIDASEIGQDERESEVAK